MPQLPRREVAIVRSRQILSSSLFLLLAGAQPLFAQAVFQPADKPLFVPSLIQTGADALAGITIASLPGIPFTATVDIENRTVSRSGAVVIQHLTGDVARDSRGRVRTVVNLNVVGDPYDPKQVTTHIYDAPRKAEITLFPGSTLALIRFQDSEPQILSHPHPLLKQIPFEQPPRLPAEVPHSERIDLGVDCLQGRLLRHGSETTSVPAAFARDKKPFTIVMDYWYSQELQAFVHIRRLGPNRSVQTVTLRNIRRANPPRSLLQIPKGYAVETQYPDNSLSQGFCPLP